MERTFHMLLYRVFHAQKNYMRPHIGELGLGIGQPKLLSYLADRSPCRQKELADYFEIDPAAVSRMMESLEKGGFVERQADGCKRRADLVFLTDRGREANRQWRIRGRQMEEQMLKGFSEQERAQFSEYLSRAYHNLKEEGTRCGI